MNYSKYFPIEEYYQKVVTPIDRKYRFGSSGKLLCPVHDDKNPSMGIIREKDGKEIVHCFGCGFWGDVVQLHQRVCSRLLKKYLSADEAIRDLCSIFGVDYSIIPKETDGVSQDKDIRVEVGIQKAQEKFDISDFTYMFREGKLQKKGVPYFNTLLMTMVSEVKACD